MWWNCLSVRVPRHRNQSVRNGTAIGSIAVAVGENGAGAIGCAQGESRVASIVDRAVVESVVVAADGFDLPAVVVEERDRLLVVDLVGDALGFDGSPFPGNLSDHPDDPREIRLSRRTNVKLEGCRRVLRFGPRIERHPEPAVSLVEMAVPLENCHVMAEATGIETESLPSIGRLDCTVSAHVVVECHPIAVANGRRIAGFHGA